MAFNLVSILIACLLLLLSPIESQVDTAAANTETECTDIDYAPLHSNKVTYCDLNNTLRAELKVKFEGFETFLDLIGKLARLIFHDCFGPKENDPSIVAICDGCIDFDNPKHAGLPHEIEKLEYIYTKPNTRGGSNWMYRMSRADFWAAAATIAIQEAASVPNSSWRMLPGNDEYQDDTLPYIPFYIGRKDCSSSPDIDITNYRQTISDGTDIIGGTKWIDIIDDITGEYTNQVEIVSKSFGEALGGFDDNYKLFQKGFGLRPREYIALLGIHTLGRVNSNNSGFGNDPGKPWVEAWDKLDNAFYNMLLDDEQREKKLDWIQHETELGGQFEWRDTLRGEQGDTRFVMLNSDMALVKDLDSESSKPDLITGECPFKSYGEISNRPASRQHVVEFARNNQKWLNEFGAVFDKMIRAGYDNQYRVPSDLEILAEKWYYDKYTKANAEGWPVCGENVNYNQTFGPYGAKKWDGGQDKIKADDRDLTLLAFAESDIAYTKQCEVLIGSDGKVGWLNYYWNSYYNDDTDMLVIDIIACCGESGSVFDRDYVAPDGFQFSPEGWYGDERDDDKFIIGDKQDPDYMLKQIVVFGIIGLVLILCIIGLILFYKRYKTKKIELELEANQPISPGKDKKKNKNKNDKAAPTVDVKTPIIDLEGGIRGNNGNSNSIPMPTDNPYIIPANSSIDEYK